MTDRFAAREPHAYVDNSLSPRERREFEARLRDDPELRRRVDMWAAQNEAIRLAYGASSRLRGPLSLGRPSNDGPSSRASAEFLSRRGGGSERAGIAAAPTRRAGLARPVSPNPIAAWAKRLAAAGCLAAILLSLSALGGPSDPRDPLMNAAVSAYRAFGDSASAPLDFATHDSGALGRWLTPKFTHAPLSADLRIPGWRLIGARVVSGMASAAAFILFENDTGERAGLLVEQLDAPPDWAPASRTVGPIALAARTQSGDGVAAVGRTMGIVAAMMRVWHEATADES